MGYCEIHYNDKLLPLELLSVHRLVTSIYHT